MLGRLTILIYHRVGETVDPLFPDEVTAQQFSDQMSLLAQLFRPLTLREAMRLVRLDKLPPRAVCVTFDDGYADNERVALPILQKHGVPATFFVATSFLDGGRMWNDTIIESVRNARLTSMDIPPLGTLDLGDVATKRQSIAALLAHAKYLRMEERSCFADQLAASLAAALPGDLMLTQQQLERLHSSGMEIGAHTVNHPILATLDDATARREIVDSSRNLGDRLGVRVESFAYPNGKPGRDYRLRDIGLVKTAGFTCAVSTAPGYVATDSDPYQLPRATPWDRTPTRFAVRLLSNYTRRQKLYA